MSDLRNRSAQEMFEDHVRRGKHGSVEEDFERNYSEDVASTGREVYRGREGLGHLARVLREELPDGAFECRTRLVKDSTAFPRWKARSESAKLENVAGSFIGDGSIVAQTIRYTDKPLGDEREAEER